VLASASDIVRLSLHVVAATVWVGGQLTLAALVPALRATGTDVPRVAARAFNRVAWPAFALLVVTGAWNLAATTDDDHGAWRVTLIVKLVIVLLSGATAYLHSRATTRTGLAVFGALTGVSSLAALVLGIALAG
jgi:putative copper export protein